LAEVKARAIALDEAESSISELERQRAMDESYYTNFSERLDQSRINERLGAEKVSNINVIQSASVPARVASKLRKIIAAILAGSVGGAVGLAFLIELFLDQSLRRPAEVGLRLGLPLFITIPRFDLSGQVLGPATPHARLIADGNESGEPAFSDLEKLGGGAPPKSNGMEIVPWDPSHALRPFSEALRDRLMTYFEAKNLTHKPKLVAVTSCARGSGVSTIASGLAASLSETGEGNVLLVEMNQEHGAAHYFHHGDLACNIDDALASERRDSALVQENLYVVTEAPNAEKVASVLPQRFKSLMPRLAASDYDYIIFDMPPVNQVSLTPRLARFMDMVLMVVESGKTTRGVANQAGAMLAETNANIGVILNKSRHYVPRWLHEEF
jgi:Mrp family chromosome partitioning ATPase